MVAAGVLVDRGRFSKILTITRGVKKNRVIADETHRNAKWGLETGGCCIICYWRCGAGVRVCESRCTVSGACAGRVDLSAPSGVSRCYTTLQWICREVTSPGGENSLTHSSLTEVFFSLTSPRLFITSCGLSDSRECEKWYHSRNSIYRLHCVGSAVVFIIFWL